MKQLFFAVLLLCQFAIKAQPPISGLVAHFPFNGNATNSTAVNVTGSAVGTSYTTNIQGVANKAIQFANNLNSYVDFVDNGNFDFATGTNFSISFGFFFNGTATSGLFDNCLNYGGYGVWLWSTVTGTWNIQFNYKNNSVGSAAATSFPLNQWNHVVAIRNNGTISVYINGVFRLSATEGTQAPTYPINANAGAMTYGSFSPPRYNPFSGKLDELRIYNRAVTATEVTALYNDFLVGGEAISITCPSNKTVRTVANQTTIAVNNIDPVLTGTTFSNVNYTLSGATTGSGTGSASGVSFKRGTTTVIYSLINDPSKTCSFTVTVLEPKYYVNNNSTVNDVFTTAVGNNANPGTAAAPYATLSYALTQATPGDTIYVDAGSYAEQVIINKGITIIGAGQNLSIFTPPATALVPAPGPFTEIGLFATTQGIGDVHISNLQIQSNGSSQNIIIQSGGSVTNCLLLSGQQGIFFRVESGAKTALIENNTIEPTGIGINSQGSGLSTLIRNNKILTSSGYFAGIYAGLDFGPLPTLTIQNNIIENYFGDGILAASYNGNYILNRIFGSGNYAINRYANGGNTPNASCNWFNSTDASFIASKISGTVNYTPFLNNGTDNSADIGFQPVNAACSGRNVYYVNDNSRTGDVFTSAIGSNSNNGSASAPFATISYALTQVAADDYIYVDAGTYTEQVTTDKGINIVGAGQTLTSILKPAVTNPPPGTFTEPGVIQTAQSIVGDVHVSNLSVTGDHTVGVTPIVIQSGGSVRNCKLQSGNQGIFVRIDPTINLATKTFVVDGNTINAEYIAVNFAGSRLTAVLTNNTLATFNPGFSTGVFAGTDFGTLPGFTATGNTFSSYVTDGIYINTNNGTITQNSFVGTGAKAINKFGGSTINATCNWYGSDLLTVVTSKITGGVTFSPWLVSGTDNSSATGFQSTPGACTGVMRNYYVNDNDITGDVFTTIAGSDENIGTASSPFRTLSKAYQTAQPGDTIYMDAGTYTSIGGTVGKSLTIRGANYLISPNNDANPQLANTTRNAETIINTSTFTIGAHNIEMSGFTFNPGTISQFVQTNTALDFDNLTLSNNIFKITSNILAINITGKQVSPLETINYAINNNRFIKESGTSGTAISVNNIDAAQINNNTFTTNNTVVNNARLVTSILVNANMGDVVMSNNTAFQQNILVNGIGAKKTTISFNKADECNRLVFAVSNNANPNETEITDNIVTNPRSTGGPVISYNRNNGVNLSSPNIARIDRNIITLNATGLTAIPQALIGPTLDAASANTQVYIRNNKLTITGDFSSLAVSNVYVSAIRYFLNSRYTLVENNDIEFTATNFNPANKFGIGILHSNLQPGTGFNFLNNKFTGFPTSIGIQNNANSNTYGELPAGVVMNINYNSFTGDVMSINNGTTGEPAEAQCNWFGYTAVQDFINKITLSKVDVIPWLTNGSDNDPATGFQQVPGSCDGYPTLITLNGSTNVTCNGGSNGSINITTSFGKAPFTYTWAKEGDANFVSHDEDPTGLAAGVYTLSIVDGNGSNIYIIDPEAEGPGKIVVTITEPAVLTASASGTNNVCFNGTIGAASVTASGGTAPYSYLWSNGAITQSISNLAAGVYSITITDANGCTVTASYEVTQPLQLIANGNGTNISCYAGNNGTATVAVSGGTAPYTYLWSNGETTQSLSNLSVGVYTVTVTDANGCTGTASYEVTQPTLLTTTASGTNTSCFGASNGTASVVATGGTATYSYLWSNGSIASAISNLSAGTYSVTVTDANGCTSTASYEVTQPAQVTAGITNSSSNCSNIATVNAGGGTAPYTYLWGNGSTNATISDVPAGTYSVTVTDANGCTATASITFNISETFSPTVSATNVSCFGANTGSITITNANGTAPFMFSKDGGTTFTEGTLPFTFNGLTAGSYNIAVKDANGCIGSIQQTITQPSQIVATANSVQGACFGQNNGSITVTVSGGVAPYTFLWSNGATTQNISNLAAGNYTLTVTDASGCTASLPVTVVAYGQINVSAQITNVQCRNTATGAIDLTVTGGSGSGFTYAWSGAVNSTSEDLINISSGNNYFVTITDIGSGCSVQRSYSVTQPSALSLKLSDTKATSCTSLGSITATANGGGGSYQYNINGGAYQSSNVFNGLGAGTYTVGVRDANGCIVTIQKVVDDTGSDDYENNNGKSQAKPISIGSTINARLAVSNDAADWFTITTPAGGGTALYSLVITHPTPGISYSLDVYPASPNNAAALTPSSVIGTTRKDYTLNPGTSYKISVTTSTLSFICYSLSVNPLVPVTTGSSPSSPTVRELPSNPVVDVLVSKVYPNPHRGSFTLSIESPEEGAGTVEMYNAAGQMIGERKVNLVKGKGNVVQYYNMNQSVLFYRVRIGKHIVNGKIIGAQ